MTPLTFEEYWDRIGSRVQVESHEERARLAFKAGWDGRKAADYTPVPDCLCGMGPKSEELPQHLKKHFGDY